MTPTSLHLINVLLDQTLHVRATGDEDQAMTTAREHPSTGLRLARLALSPGHLYTEVDDTTDGTPAPAGVVPQPWEQSDLMKLQDARRRAVDALWPTDPLGTPLARTQAHGDQATRTLRRLLDEVRADDLLLLLLAREDRLLT